ncbi:Mur ligase family protein [Mesorhizobium sp.]|uniref:Mur ligase family protein n=1 Tax=Mesorhizobium sp. TaxID=1871066 RepID=UPI00257EC2E0|nr:Mur ligase family protein [Mesorhizobium sp.]
MRLANAVLVDRTGPTSIKAYEHYCLEAPAFLRAEPCFLFEKVTFSVRMRKEGHLHETTRELSRDTIAVFEHLFVEPAHRVDIECAMDGKTVLCFSMTLNCSASLISVSSFTEQAETMFAGTRHWVQSLPFDRMLTETRSQIDERGAKLVFVTGSVGKTTTKELIGSVLSRHMPTAISTDSWNFPHEICSQIVNNADWASVFVMEAALGRHLTAMGKLLAPDILVITHIGHAHTSFSGDLTQLARQKLALAACMRKGGKIIFDGEQDFVKRIIFDEVTPVKNGDVDLISILSSKSRRSGIRAFRDSDAFYVEDESSRVTARIMKGAGEIPPISVGCAYAVWRELGGTETSEFVSAVSSFPGVPGRLEKVQVGRVRVINDAYNANPASMARFVSALVSERSAGNRVFAVMGEMLDLGELSEEMHAIAVENALKSSDALLLCGKAYAKWQSGQPKGVYYLEAPSPSDILERLMAEVGRFDVFAFKGSLATGIFGAARTFQRFLSRHFADQDAPQ